MDWWLLTFFLGAILSLFLPIVPVLFQLFLLLLLSIAFLYHKKLRSSSGLLFGVLWLLFNAYSYDQKIPGELVTAMQTKQVVIIEGQVMTLSPQINDNREKQAPQPSSSYKFNFKVNKVNHKEVSEPFIVRLNGGKTLLSAAQGQVLALKVKLKPAHGLANLGSFNYQAWLKSKSIVATGYVVNKKENALKNSLILNSVSLRQKLFNQYQALLFDANLHEHALMPLILALAFGERSQLMSEHWEILQATGTGHLIAISGLHIGLVASGGYFFVMMLVRLLPIALFSQLSSQLSRKLLNCNSRYSAIFFSISLALFYGFLAGFSLPTQRALVMLLIYWLARFLVINLSIKRWFLLTIFILVLMNPFSLFTASFWLSIYAVSIIFLTLWRFRFYIKQGNTFLRFIKGLLVIQLSLTLMLLPISALFFQKLSMVALFANLVAVPWMSFISIPCALLSVVVMPFNDLAGQFFAKICLESMSILWPYLTYLADLSFAQRAISQWELLLLSLITLFIFIMVFLSPSMPKLKLMQRSAGLIKALEIKHRLSYLSAVGVSIVGMSFAGGITLFVLEKNSDLPKQEEISHQPNVWQLHLFDVGQGLSVLISSNNKALLYDTGAAYRSGFNMVDSVVLPYLQYAGINQLDKVFLSHSDNDHAGGINQLLSNIEVKQLITNDSKIATKHKKTLPCYQGMSFHWQKLTIKALWPIDERIKGQLEESFVQKYIKQGNDDSCVLFISDGKHKVLLTGDISKKVEQQLLLIYPELTADVLVVPHHGSKTSSSSEFIEQLSPDISLVSAGFLNRWRMPVEQVVQRYEQRNIRLIKSSDKGQVVLTFTDNISVENYHDDFRPFWFSR